MRQERIKILHVVDSLGIGGMERVLIDIVNGLDQQRFQQAICTITRLGTAAERVQSHVTLIDMAKGAASDLAMPLKLVKVLRAYQPDIVHTRSWSGVDGALASIFVPHAKLVQSEHGRNLPYIHFEPTKRKIVRRVVYQLADVVFTVSEEMRQYFCRETGFNVARMRVVPNGIDLAQLDAADATGLRAEWGIAPDDCVIGTVARLQETKDVATLVRAFAQLAQGPASNGQKLKLLLVGDGAERARLETLASELKVREALIITGLRHDVARFLKIMDVFAFPSLSEGLPGAVLEAMGAALPVVATNVGALPELVRVGETGYLVEVQAPAAMAECLARLVTNRAQAKTFGAAARNFVEREYTLQAMLQRYDELYSSMVS